MTRSYNFFPGPAALPLEVLERAREEMVEFPGAGMSLLECSHRGKIFRKILEEALARLRRLLRLPDDFHVLFLGGGATLQFGMVPLNLARGRPAAYAVTGQWSKKALADARKICRPQVVFDGAASGYMTLPPAGELVRQVEAEAAYLYLVSNETIGGLQWPEFPEAGETPLVADMSSDILSRPIPWERFGLVFAGAQKNLGPAGATLVLIRDELLQRCPDDLPVYLDYRAQVKNEGLLNTPPVFAVYLTGLVLEWLENKGGIAWAEKAAAERAALVYGAVEASGGFYLCPVEPPWRSKMNVVFRLPHESLEKKFLEQAESEGLLGLAGHRSVGGLRASLYNAMPIDGARALADLMRRFAAGNG